MIIYVQILIYSLISLSLAMTWKKDCETFDQEENRKPLHMETHPCHSNKIRQGTCAAVRSSEVLAAAHTGSSRTFANPTSLSPKRVLQDPAMKDVKDVKDVKGQGKDGQWQVTSSGPTSDPLPAPNPEQSACAKAQSCAHWTSDERIWHATTGYRNCNTLGPQICRRHLEGIENATCPTFRASASQWLQCSWGIWWHLVRFPEHSWTLTSFQVETRPQPWPVQWMAIAAIAADGPFQPAFWKVRVVGRIVIGFWANLVIKIKSFSQHAACLGRWQGSLTKRH